MSSKLLVNLIDPNSIVVPDTDGIPDAGTPDTGILGIGEQLKDIIKDNAALFIVVSLVALAVIITITILLIWRHKRQSLVNGFSGYTSMKLNTKRHLIPKLAGLSFIILVSVFGVLKFNDNQRMANAETMEGPALTITTEEITAIDIEMDDEAVFGIGESKVKVTTATETGYTLMAYVDSKTTSLVNEDGDTIEMLETSQSQALTDNTWGISLSKPNSQEETLFRGLPTAEKDAMVVKVSGSSATEANDETTLYYATYVTPELDYGTYEGVTINYVAVAHVLDEDVTVNFHGNGYYFDEAGTKDVNTVTYGTSCGLAYVGGNCTKVYTTEGPYAIVKTPNIRDDGTQDGAYPQSEHDNQIGWSLPVANKIVSAPGANALKVEIDYAVSGEFYIDIFYDAINDIMSWDGWDGDEYEEIGIFKPSASKKSLTIPGDTITIAGWAYGEPIEGYDYGFYAKVYPIYNSAPDGVETIESTYCYFAKSDNLDDEGNMVEPYYDGWQMQTIALPGADKVKIDIEYALTSDAYIAIFEGQVNPGPDMPSFSYMLSTWDEESDTSTNISGRETFIVDDSTVTFMLSAYDMPVSGYNYGFYARLYPVYDEEHEDTIPEQICSFANKSGEYSLPVGYGNEGALMKWDIWYDVVDDDGYLIDNRWFHDENDLKSEIVYYYDSLAGKTIDVYLGNNYYIHYDANGGSGSMDVERVLPHTNAWIWYNEFENSGYQFIGWNTRADGNGTWYQPDDVVLDLAQPGEAFTLYAQWEVDNSGVIDYYPNAYGVTDSMGTQILAETDTSAILWASNFKRPGYGFAGWSDKSDWVLGENDSNGNGTGANAGYRIYGPNQKITFYSGQYNVTNGGLALYAVWVPSAGNLQSWTCPSDNDMPIGSVTALTDLRDNDTYAVAKLADGKCWMIENLRLDADADFTPSLSQGFGGLFTGLANSESYFSGSVTSNSLYKYDGSGDIAGINGATHSDIGLDNDPAYRMPRYYNASSVSVVNMTSPSQQAYSYGNYYSWAAAKANTSYLDYEGSKAANTSICPAGWHLPTGGVPGEFYELSVSLGGPIATEGTTYLTWSKHTFGNFPNNFVDSGYVGGSAHSQGGSGEYLSSNSQNSECGAKCVYDFWFHSHSETLVVYSTGKDYFGSAVRCIADEDVNS
ncbi:InlB B-repeat-containing protein [Candidatus Saccharibacteria bacterium]|nr:InlB B-repeat-containing protein [Candidatus Saccharibacteria bacterium]